MNFIRGASLSEEGKPIIASLGHQRGDAHHASEGRRGRCNSERTSTTSSLSMV
jgi:hypothetical protein